MKKILTLVAAVAGFSAVSYGQGTVLFSTTASAASKTSVNSSVGGTTFALTPTTSTYYYALFASATANTVLGSSAAIVGGTGASLASGASYVFNDANWTFISYGLSSATGAGKFASSGTVNSDGSTTISFATAASSINVVAVGWSSNIGSTVQSLESFFAGSGPTSGFTGESAVASIPAGSVPGSGQASPESLFGIGAGQVGGTKLGEVVVPEPTSIALGVMGGLSLLALRRKKA